MDMTKLLIALGFIVFDIITGLAQALKNGTYKSSVMREGLYHKLGEVLSMGFAYGCEYSFPYVGIDITIPICSSVMIYIIIMETGSIIENLSQLSPELKAIFSKVFKSYGEDAQTQEQGKHEKH